MEALPGFHGLDVIRQHVRFHLGDVTIDLSVDVADAVLRRGKSFPQRDHRSFDEQLDGKWLGAVVDQLRTGMEGRSHEGAVEPVDPPAVHGECVVDRPQGVRVRVHASSRYGIAAASVFGLPCLAH